MNREQIIKTYSDLFDSRHGHPAVGEGWLPLVESFLESVAFDIEHNKMPPVKVTCIKEKFGRLNIYFNGGDGIAHAYARLAGELSGKMCESCGTSRNLGLYTDWIKLSCKECHEEWLQSPAAEVRPNRKWFPLDSDDEKVVTIRRMFKF